MIKQYYASDNINEGSFEDWETIVDATFEMDFDAETMEKDGVPLVSDGHLARGYPLEQPMMVVAATGSGKTRRLIIQYLLSCILSACSMLINDPKGELYKHIKKLLEKLGYNVIVFDLRNLNYGERFNFLQHPAKLYKAGNTRRADEMFQAMFDTFMATVRSEKDPYWHMTGAAYLTGLAELCCDLLPAEMVTINSVYELHLQGNKRIGPNTLLKMYMDMHEDKPYNKLIAPYVNAPNDTRASLDSVLTSAISKFCRNSSVIDQTTNSTFDIADLVEKKTAMFIISRDESTVYNALITAVVNEIYEVVIDMAEEKYNGRLPRRLAIVLDEFGNLAPIDDINAKITVSRSRNVGWCLCCQSLDQLNLKYTADVAKIILGNCNIAYMYSSDINLLKMLSDLCGKTTDEYTHESKPLLSVEQLRHFNKKEGQTLFLLERMRPFIGYLPDISEYNVVPEKKAEFKKRKPQDLKRIDFESIVKKEKDRQIAEATNALGKNSPIGRRPSGFPPLPDFLSSINSDPFMPENMSQRHNKQVTDSNKSSADLASKDLTSKKNHENDPQKGNIDIDELMAKIDKRIAELEEEERREQEALKKRASEQKLNEIEKPEVKRTPNPKGDRSTCSIVIKSISSFEMTSAVICTYLALPSQEGDSLLRKTLARKDRKLTGIPRDKASMIMTMFKNIGTIATKVDEVA